MWDLLTWNKLKHFKFTSQNQCSILYISSTNEFPEVTPDAYEAHSITDGHYYGNMPAGKR